MIIEGEKWACEACVRGHRVSNCVHYGRPVTQCQHCRSQRKNRSAHVKCDCGEKTTKCIHLGAIEGHRESCCCNHGGRCSCSFKKDLDPVPEAGAPAETAAAAAAATGAGVSTAPKPAVAKAAAAAASASSGCCSSKNPTRRRRANTTRSEGTLSFDEHNRHKSLSHKHTKAASQKSNPYSFNRVSSIRSTGSLSGFLHASAKAEQQQQQQHQTVEEVESDDHSSANTASESGADEEISASVVNPLNIAQPPLLTTQLSQQQRRSRSEAGSPLLFGGSFPQPHQINPAAQLSPLNMGALSFPSFGNIFGNDPTDQPLFSAGLQPPSIDWSQFGLDPDRSFAASLGEDKLTSDPLGFSSTAGTEFNGSEQAPTMTTATSGDVSEAEDILGPGLDDYDFDGTDAASSSVAAFSRTSSTHHMVNLNNPTDFHDQCFLKASNKFLPTPQATGTEDMSPLVVTANLPSSLGLDDEETALWMPEYHGLPSMTDSPDSDALSLWDNHAAVTGI